MRKVVVRNQFGRSILLRQGRGVGVTNRTTKLFSNADYRPAGLRGNKTNITILGAALHDGRCVTSANATTSYDGFTRAVKLKVWTNLQPYFKCRKIRNSTLTGFWTSHAFPTLVKRRLNHALMLPIFIDFFYKSHWFLFWNNNKTRNYWLLYLNNCIVWSLNREYLILYGRYLKWEMLCFHLDLKCVR